MWGQAEKGGEEIPCQRSEKRGEKLGRQSFPESAEQESRRQEKERISQRKREKNSEYLHVKRRKSPHCFGKSLSAPSFGRKTFLTGEGERVEELVARSLSGNGDGRGPISRRLKAAN